jgi:hypothetical protein
MNRVMDRYLVQVILSFSKCILGSEEKLFSKLADLIVIASQFWRKLFKFFQFSTSKSNERNSIQDI